MILAAILVGLNICHSYDNVRVAVRQEKRNVRPLLYLLPFVFTVIIQVAWLSHPRVNDSWIIGSASFVPFLCAWGLQFAHQVGRIILAHVTKDRFPVWDSVWILSVIGAADANLPLIGLWVASLSAFWFLDQTVTLNLQIPSHSAVESLYDDICLDYICGVLYSLCTLHHARHSWYHWLPRYCMLRGEKKGWQRWMAWRSVDEDLIL